MQLELIKTKIFVCYKVFNTPSCCLVVENISPRKYVSRLKTRTNLSWALHGKIYKRTFLATHFLGQLQLKWVWISKRQGEVNIKYTLLNANNSNFIEDVKTYFLWIYLQTSGPNPPDFCGRQRKYDFFGCLPPILFRCLTSLFLCPTFRGRNPGFALFAKIMFFTPFLKSFTQYRKATTLSF